MRGLPVDRPLVTARRLEVLRLAANGYTNAEIAARLWITEDSVKAHMHLACERLGARGRAHAVAICLVRGLIHPHEVELLPPRSGPAGPRKGASGARSAPEAAGGARESREAAEASESRTAPRDRSGGADGATTARQTARGAVNGRQRPAA